jgi:ABC-2 type transport system permease protein
MLWYKAWLETRSRFLLSLLGIVALCSFSVYHGNDGALPDTGRAYYYVVLHGGHGMLCMMWVCAVPLLAMGGLLREKAVGTAAFTLALPVSRARLMAVRVGMIFAESMVLVIVPWIAMGVVARMTGKADALVSQGFFQMALLAGGGMFFFGVALLISSLVEGEYTAPVVTFGVLFGICGVMSSTSLHTYSPMEFLVGNEFVNRSTRLLVGPIPWVRIACHVLLGGVLVATATKSVKARDF